MVTDLAGRAVTLYTDVQSKVDKEGRQSPRPAPSGCG